MSLFIATPGFATKPVAGTENEEALSIQGVTLSMSPQQAFEHLKSPGFRAGNIDSIVMWEGDGIEFVRSIYGSPDGFRCASIARWDDRITRISETYNAPGKQLDAEAEIGAAKRHPGCTDETRQCDAPRPNSGTALRALQKTVRTLKRPSLSRFCLACGRVDRQITH